MKARYLEQEGGTIEKKSLLQGISDDNQKKLHVIDLDEFAAKSEEEQLQVLY